MLNKKHLSVCMLILFILRLFSGFIYAQTDIKSFLSREFNLAGNPSTDPQFFIMESELITMALDGKRTGKDVFSLFLKCAPAIANDKSEYSCIKFFVQLGDSSKNSIPALENWSYSFVDGIDEQKQVFGIAHDKFENLQDKNGKPIPQDKAYHIYNAFIDFHAFSNVFANATTQGQGIQDLKKVNQKIVHDAAFSEAPTNLGQHIAEGSFFKNGEITLEFKGLGVANNHQCVILGIDSGESLFKMIYQPMPNLNVITVGSSHYQGDILKSLSNNWMQKVQFTEVVICETTLPMPPNKINLVVERNIQIVNMNEERFYAELNQ